MVKVDLSVNEPDGPFRGHRSERVHGPRVRGTATWSLQQSLSFAGLSSSLCQDPCAFVFHCQQW